MDRITLTDCELRESCLDGRQSAWNPKGVRAFGMTVRDFDADVLEVEGVRVKRLDDEKRYVHVSIDANMELPFYFFPGPKFSVEVNLVRWKWQDMTGTKLYFNRFLPEE